MSTAAFTLSKYEQEMKGKVRDSTLHMYVFSLRDFFKFMSGSGMNSVSAQSYVDALAAKGLSPSTVSLRAHAIMSYFRWRKHEIHLDCPSIVMKKPEYLKQPEIDKLISFCADQQELTIIVVLYDTAVRISELLNLTLKDIDWDAKTILVTRKGGRQDEVNISDKALVELKKWLSSRHGESDKVFLGLDYYTTWLMLKDLGKRANINNMHPHILRHSRAIAMLRGGAKPFVVQQHLGHKSITTTMNIYGMFMASDLKAEIPQW